MKISFQNKSSYNCAPIDSNYTKTKEDLEKYMTKRSIAPFFANNGGKMEIECGDEMKFSKEYIQLSDEFSNCYYGHINGANNEYSCIENNISNYESRCCFIESSKQNNKTIIEDKRCYMIKEEYFNNGKNFNNYLLDELNVKSLEEIKNLNLTIKCKNYDTFYFISKNSKRKENETETKGLQNWIIATIIILIIIIILVAAFLIYRWKKRQSISMNKSPLISK